MLPASQARGRLDPESAAQYFDGGDAWYTPLFKIAVDQTAWSVLWNSLYYVLLGVSSLLLADTSSMKTKHWGY